MDVWEQVCCNSAGLVSLDVSGGPWVALTENSSFNSGEASGLESRRKWQKSGFSGSAAALVSFYLVGGEESLVACPSLFSMLQPISSPSCNTAQ